MDGKARKTALETHQPPKTRAPTQVKTTSVKTTRDGNASTAVLENYWSTASDVVKTILPDTVDYATSDPTTERAVTEASNAGTGTLVCAEIR